MRTVLLIAVLCIPFCGCDFIAPGVSKAQTERKQLETSELELKQLTRIADALEAMND